MFSLLLSCAPEDADFLAAELWEAGTLGIVEEPGGIRAFFDDDAPALIARFASRAPAVCEIQDRDWEEIARASFPPFEIGARFFLVPPWNLALTPPGRLRLVIEPGMACGTGWHPCTQLCLEALEECVRPGCKVFDVGSGSGILSEAARLLGADRVIGCDLEAESVRIARERIAVPMFVGSVNAARGGWANVAVANIGRAAAEELAPDLRRVAAPNATLILSGFQRDDLPVIPLGNCERRERDGWVCLILT